MITASFEQITDAMARVTPVLLDSALKGTAVLAIAWLVISRMHRWSSAARHMAWLATLASLLVLPPLGRVLPAWRVLPESWDVRGATLVQQAVEAPRVEPVAETPRTEPVRSQSLRMPDDLAARPRGEAKPPALPTAPVAAAPAARPVSRWAWIGLAWLIGAGLLLMRLAVGLACLWWANLRLQPCEDAGWRCALEEVCADLGIGRRVRLLQGRGNAMPMTWGLFVPHLLVPQAGDWTPQRRRVVLLHELAHVKRWDCLAQMVAEVVCATEWFNPLAWVASRRMQNEAERACDDLVIARGSQPAEYAEHLLQIAASQHQGYLAAAMAAIPMARASKLEGRLLAILDGQRSRRAMTLGVFILALALTAGVVVPVAMLRAANRPAETSAGASPTTAPAGQAIAQLPGGLTVEIAGVSYHPSKGREWWAPDGTVGEQYAFATGNSRVSGPNMQAREFVARLKGQGAAEAGLKWQIKPSVSSAAGSAKPVKGTAEGVLQYMAATLPAGDKTATVRVDVASGPWMTLAEETGDRLTASDRTDRKGPTIFGPAYESNGGTGVSVSHNILEGQVRITAIDKDGRERSASQLDDGRAGGIVQTTAYFANLLPKDVKSFRLEGRGYLWVTFRNVSLEPGYKTDVQVEVGPEANVADEARRAAAEPVHAGGLFTTVVKGPGTSQSARETARRPAKRAVSANNVGMLGRGIHIYQAEFKRWPDDLRDLVEKGLKKPYDESADYLVNPERPAMRPAYIYIKPPPLERVDNPGREVAFYEAFDDWGDGINVGFLDGHVVFMDNQDQFRKLLSRENQKRMEDLLGPQHRDLLSSRNSPAASAETKDEDHVVEPGDRLRITISELLATGTESVFGRQVNESGYVSIPVLNSVKLAGMTPREAETHIADLLQPKINRRPPVSVVRLTKEPHAAADQTNANLGAPGGAPAAALPAAIPSPTTQPEGEFYVMGTVRPGVFSLTGRRISLAQGVAAAGGLPPGAKTVQLLRPGKDGVLGVVATYSVDEAPWKDSPILQPGDVIYVSEKALGASPVISIAGDVPRPGEYPLQAGTTLLKALVAAGLNAADAGRTHVQIQRTFTNGRAWMGSGFEVVRILRGEIPDEPLRPGDDIQVTVSKPDASVESAKPSTSRPASPAPASQPLPQARVYVLRYAETVDMAVRLGKVLGGRFGKDSPKVIADERTNSIIVAAPPEQHAVIEEMLQLLDQPGRTAPAAQTRPAAATQPDVDVEFVRIRSGDSGEIADRAQGVLDALYGKHAPVVEAKPSGSTVYVTGSKEQRQIAVQVIGKLDQIAGGHALDEPFSVRTVEGTEVRMVPARGDSEEIVDQSQKILDAIYGKQSPFVEGRDGYIAITGRTEHLDKAAEIIRKLEADVPPGGPSPATQSGQSAVRGRRGVSTESPGSQPAATQPLRDIAPQGNAGLPPGYKTRAEQLAEAKDHAARLKAKYETYVKDGLEKVPLNSGMVAAVESDPQIASLERQRTELVEARRSLVERFGERHRSVSDLDKRLEAVDKETQTRRLEKIGEQKKLQVERIRSAMEAAEAETRRLEQASSGSGPN